jgi:AraC family transcriptional regulator
LVGSLTLLAPSYDYIFGEWVVQNNIELADNPCFEKYLTPPDKTHPERNVTEIWVPLK